jgi:hypothetical protein
MFNNYFESLSWTTNCHLGLAIIFNDVKWTSEILKVDKS